MIIRYIDCEKLTGDAVDGYNEDHKYCNLGFYASLEIWTQQLYRYDSAIILHE